jgi:hypothetical protein
MMGKISS